MATSRFLQTRCTSPDHSVLSRPLKFEGQINETANHLHIISFIGFFCGFSVRFAILMSYSLSVKLKFLAA